MALGFTFGQVPTVLLPSNFQAPPSILTELRVSRDRQVPEFSEREYSLRLRRTECIAIDGNPHPWVKANPDPAIWSVFFHSPVEIYGTDYWRNYEPEGLLEYLRIQTNSYSLRYHRNRIPIFTCQVEQYNEDSNWFVRINTVWHNDIAASQQARSLILTNATDLFLQDISRILTPSAQCAVCLDDAFLENWQTCTHSFCHECMTTWRRARHQITCPLCRAVWN